MSGNLGELTVRFTGDASSLSSTISKVQSELSGMNAMSQKGVKSIAEQTRQMGGYDKIVAKSAESLKQKRSILAETEKEYKKNTKQLNENIKGLNGQKSAIGSLMTSKNLRFRLWNLPMQGLIKAVRRIRMVYSPLYLNGLLSFSVLPIWFPNASYG